MTAIETMCLNRHFRELCEIRDNHCKRKKAYPKVNILRMINTSVYTLKIYESFPFISTPLSIITNMRR